MNRKFDGNVKITRRPLKGSSSQAARVARFDMQKENITPLEEKDVFTPEELDDLYQFEPDKEPWWNR